VLDPQLTNEYYLLTTTIQKMQKDLRDMKLSKKIDIYRRLQIDKKMQERLDNL
jgi:hypothetical protein